MLTVIHNLGIMKNQNNLVLILVIAIISFQTTIAQYDLNENLNKIIEKSLNELIGIPGLSLAIVKNDTIVLLKSFGYSDVENKIKANTKTPYYIASTTKSFTGTLAQILHDEGVIDLDLPITGYKPIKDFKNKELFRNITIRNLLTHTSGISNGYLVWRNATSGEYTHDKLVDVLEHYTSPLDNNKSFKYDNLGYNIFDLILQEEFNLDWKKLLDERIFTPLKMNNTTAFYSKVVNNKWPTAKPYLTIENVNAPTKANSKKDEKTMQAAGGLYTSIEDITHWLLFNTNKGVFNGKRIYSEKTLKQTHKAYATVDKMGVLFQETGYGLGWHNALFQDTKVLYHNGGFIGHSARIAFMPEEKIGIAVFVNESFFGDNVADLLISFAFNYFLGKNEAIETYMEEIESLKGRVNRMSESYTKSMSERKNRLSSLTLNLSEYVGKYENDGFGTITIDVEDNKLIIQIGLLKSEAFYAIDKNTVEVEFSGPGSITKMAFVLENSQIKGIKHKGLEFKKQ
ncbi:serine hydrolase [Muriicola sp. Z0-33]|uniref:serine hydrolase n=1 Tax=Muriicola sp. Z0-33 TaxID=2816957 RepID=UPI0022386C8E|nr:serine hydrolase [Muriicola sp. Z0-33]MCW5518135.1 serine hydrolase [Muriicola sp. Z0-33]